MDEKDPVAGHFAETLSAAALAVNDPVQRQRAERIAELRRLYLSGEYRPDAQEIASKLIDEHLS